MANLKTILTITHGTETAGTLKDMLFEATTDPRGEAYKLKKFFNAAAGGGRSCKIDALVAPVAATGTITFSSIADADTITIAGVVLTAKTSPSGASQFAVGASDTAAAANAVVKINAHTSLTGIVTATSNGAVITITSAVNGTIGNAIATAISAHGSVSGALLTGGTQTNSATYHLGV